MIKVQITAFIAVFFMATFLTVSPALTLQEQEQMQSDYSARLKQEKELQADLKVKRMADAYARMSDKERIRGDAEAYKEY
ncbi:hypothetical protein [Snodgrassella alvi]|uniref:hypothetical protein n=1 Tax=Snodgrassella alvi TaxID=1196083 RepID=UPI0035132047